MSRRTVPLLLGALVLVSLGAMWLASGIGSSGAGGNVDGQVSAAPPGTGTTPGNHARSLTDLPRGDAPRALAVDPATPRPDRELAAAPDPERELDGAIWIEGRVVLPPGTPVDEHVEVVADGSPFPTREMHRAPIGADGSFRVAFAPDTQMGGLVLEARYVYLPTLRTIFVRELKEPVVLEPHLGGALRGRIVLTKSALSQASALVGQGVRVRTKPVDASWRASGQPDSRTVKLSDTLEFEATSLPPGACRLVLLATGVVSVDGDELKIRAGQVEDANLLVEAASRLEGVVVDPAGAAVTNARISLRWIVPGPFTDVGSRSRSSVNADAEGAFTFRDVEPGTTEVWASAPTWFESRPVVLELRPGETIPGLRLELRPGGAISGTVRDAEGAPATRVPVNLVLKDGSAPERAIGRHSAFNCLTDREGRFAFRELGGGEYAIRAGGDKVLRSGPVATLEGIRIAPGESSSGNDLRLASPGTIEGRVVAADGSPPAVALVWAESNGLMLSPIEAWATTDDEGHFVLEGVAPGSFRLLAQRGRLVSPVAVPVTVQPDGTTEVEIELVPGTLLYASVQDESGRSAPARIDLVGAECFTRGRSGHEGSNVPGLYPERDAAESGRMIGPLPPGAYTVRATDDRGRIAEETVRLEGQAKARVVLRLGAAK